MIDAATVARFPRSDVIYRGNSYMTSAQDGGGRRRVHKQMKERKVAVTMILGVRKCCSRHLSMAPNKNAEFGKE